MNDVVKTTKKYAERKPRPVILYRADVEIRHSDLIDQFHWVRMYEGGINEQETRRKIMHTLNQHNYEVKNVEIEVDDGTE